jgi:hypothetical protein
MNYTKYLYTGLGQAVKLGFGVKPDRVRLTGIGAATFKQIEWLPEYSRAATGAGGILRAGVANTPGFALLALTAGVRLYDGGDTVSAASLAYQVPANQVPAYRGNLAGAITRWVLDNAANRTGHFDGAVATASCGIGSPVDVDHELAYIHAISNSGNAANEVTLSKAVPSGKCFHIGAKVDLVVAPVGTVMPAGIEILDVANCNEASTVYLVEIWH